MKLNTQDNSKAKRSPFRSDLQAARRGELDLAGLRDYAMKYPNYFMARTEDLIADGKLKLRDVPDLKALFRAFVDVRVQTRVDLMGEMRSIETSAFPLLMGNLAVAALNEAYDAIPTIGQDLVTEMDSNKKFSHIVKVTQQAPADVDVDEGKEFPLITAGEQFSVIGHNRKGFRMKCSQETLEENDIGNFISLIDFGGEFASDLVEVRTLKKVTDHDGSAASGTNHVYRPGGTGTAIYRTTAGTQTPSGTRVHNNALVSAANLEAARRVLANMRNTRGERIAIPLSKCKLLVPDALSGVADTILTSIKTPGVENETNPYGPEGRHRIGNQAIRSTPKLDDLSSTAWILGWFERQFKRKWKIRMETVTVAGDMLEFLRTRTAWEMRVAFDVEIGATDDVFCVQSLAAATAPKDVT